mgnify:CR=1 FL=1
MAGRYRAYSAYKPSYAVWSGDVPEHWEPIRLKHVFKEKKKKLNPELHAGSISFGNVVFKNEGSLAPETKASYQELLPGEFLINPLNMNFDLLSLRTALSSIAVVVSTGYLILQSESGYDKRYLRWLLQQFDVAHMKTLGAGVRQTIGFTDIGNSFIFAPSLPEQTQIAVFLDHETAKIDTLIAKQERLIELLEEKRQAVISHAVTKGLNPDAPLRPSGIDWLGDVPVHWEVKRAKHISDVFVPQRNKPEFNENFGVSWATMDDMKSKCISSTKLRVDDAAARKAGSKTLAKGAVIASCVGNFGIASINKIDVIINQQLQAYVPRTIQPEFLRETVTISKAYFEQIGTAATLVYVNQQGFENLPVLQPPSSEQTEICQFVEQQDIKFEAMLTKARSAIPLLKERRTALISAAVTGKIDVRDWQPPKDISDQAIEQKAFA